MRTNKVERTITGVDPQGRTHRVQVGWVYSPSGMARGVACGSCRFQKIVMGNGSGAARDHLRSAHGALGRQPRRRVGTRDQVAAGAGVAAPAPARPRPADAAPGDAVDDAAKLAAVKRAAARRVAGTSGHQPNGEGPAAHRPANTSAQHPNGRSSRGAGWAGGDVGDVGAGPSDLEAAVALVRAGRAAEARGLLERIVASHPDLVEAQFQLGIALLRSSRTDWPAAEAWFASVVSRQERHPWAWHYLGLAREALGRTGDAVAAYRRAAAINPANEAARQKLRDLGEAIEPPTDPDPSATAAGAGSGGGPGGSGPGSAPQPAPSAPPRPDAAADPARAVTPGEVVWRGRRRVASYWTSPAGTAGAVWSLLFGAAVGIAVPVWAFANTERPFEAIAVTVTLLFVAFAVVLAISYVIRSWCSEYVIHERRIDLREGVFVRREESVWMYEVLDVRFKQTLLQRLVSDAAILLRVEDRAGAGGKQEPIRLAGVLADDREIHRLYQLLREHRPVERRTVKGVFV
jgi:membrane protein YdbS with pleckstrin-like domain